MFTKFTRQTLEYPTKFYEEWEARKDYTKWDHLSSKINWVIPMLKEMIIVDSSMYVTHIDVACLPQEHTKHILVDHSFVEGNELVELEEPLPHSKVGFP